MKNKNHNAHIKLSFKVTAQKRSLQLLFSFETSLSVSSSPHTEQQVFLQDPELKIIKCMHIKKEQVVPRIKTIIFWGFFSLFNFM